jgi:pimeloyl-ACP methyl ester carboxylesterase
VRRIGVEVIKATIMRSTRLSIAIAIVVVILPATVAIIARSQLPGVGAGALLFPSRHRNTQPLPDGCVNRTFNGEDLTLDGWQCTSPAAVHRGTIVYLHGVADNRGSAVTTILRMLPKGFDVIAYDSRGHGASQGDRCTYGYFEKRDLQRVLDQLGVDKVILIGHSLGAAVALQEAAIDPRIRAVVAASTFADLRSIATERAPSVFTPSLIKAAFERAEHDAAFVVDEVSPVRAAAALAIPVLIIHGALDRETRPAHSESVFAALRGPKELWLVRDAGHNDVLRGDVWNQIELWLSSVLEAAPGSLPR